MLRTTHWRFFQQRKHKQLHTTTSTQAAAPRSSLSLTSIHFESHTIHPHNFLTPSFAKATSSSGELRTKRNCWSYCTLKKATFFFSPATELTCVAWIARRRRSQQHLYFFPPPFLNCARLSLASQPHTPFCLGKSYVSHIFQQKSIKSALCPPHPRFATAHFCLVLGAHSFFISWTEGPGSLCRSIPFFFSGHALIDYLHPNLFSSLSPFLSLFASSLLPLFILFFFHGLSLLSQRINKKKPHSQKGTDSLWSNSISFFFFFFEHTDRCCFFLYPVVVTVDVFWARFLNDEWREQG